MCSLKALLNLTTGLIQCFCFKKPIYPSYLRAAPAWQPHTGISFQKVLNERRKEDPAYKKAGLGALHKKYKANKSTKTQPREEHNNQDTTNLIYNFACCVRACVCLTRQFYILIHWQNRPLRSSKYKWKFTTSVRP